ncbi:MAG TPA: tRNA (guanosine(37)-N1)-methyltransferase TrmD [Vicinamibacterales bacterium]|nr:tRNA (guanosine(37)-N1)-methyltransferase TrmD [Vicinamibacterales bacterium]
MKIDIVTIFPEMVEAALAPGVIGRARQAGVLDIAVHNLRDFTADRHRVVDDVPFGGGPGMVLKPEPMFVAVETLAARRGTPDAVLLMSPAGEPLTQAAARRFAELSHLVVLCGRYEGIDERVREELATEEISIGDYVLSGGELPALVVVDAVSRLVPGVVGDEQSVEADSFTCGLLDYPHYTRPADYRGHKVPDVLTSGHHGEIRAWRRREALRRTAIRRPELLASADLDDGDREFLRGLEGGNSSAQASADTARADASTPPNKGSKQGHERH